MMKQSAKGVGVDEPIGRSIRRIRESVGMSRAQLAEGIGCTDEMIAQYEDGTRPMETTVFFSVAQTLGVTPNDFAPKSMREKAPGLFGYAKLNGTHREIIDSVVNSFLLDERKAFSG